MRSTITLALVAAALAGCGSGETASTTGSSSTPSATPAANQTFTIAVIPKGSTHDYWKSVHEGANTAKDELKDVNIDWNAPLKEDDRDSQIKIVEDALNKNVNGIVLAPLDDKALAKYVDEAAKQNVPVVIIDSGVQTDSYISFIATNNENGGETDGEELAKELGGKGKVIMLRYEEGSASTDAREKGFMEAMKKSPGIQVVSSDQYGGATVDTAKTASENLLAPHRKGDSLDIDGIYCPNESTTFGMLLALKENSLAGKVHFVGFDASPKLIDALKAGEINALVVQNPRKMGYDGVKTIVEYLKGNKNVQKQEDTGATLVTKANIGDPKIAELIAPPKE